MTSITVTEDSGARYYRDGDGELLPSVTTVLAATAPKKWGLEVWQAQLGPAAEAITDIARARGTRMHALIEEYSRTRVEAEPDNPWWVSIAPVVRMLSSIMWIRAVEQPLVHHIDRFGGTPDDVGMLGEECVIHDWKSGHRKKTRIELDEISVQLAGYADLVAYGGWPRPKRGVIVVSIVDNDEPQRAQIEPVDLEKWAPEWRDRLAAYWSMR